MIRYVFLLVLVSGVARLSDAQNLDEGKTGADLFRTNCSGCHGSPHGLMRNASANEIQTFMLQHYTVDGRSARDLTNYLVSARANEIGKLRQRSQPADLPPIKRNPSVADELSARPSPRGAMRAKEKRRDATHPYGDGCPVRYSCYSLYGAYGP